MFGFLKGWNASQKAVEHNLARVAMLMYALDSHASMPIAKAVASLNRTMGFTIPLDAKCRDDGPWRDPENDNFYVGFTGGYSEDPRVDGFWIDGAREAQGLLYQGHVGDGYVSWQASIYPNINPPMLAVALAHHLADIPKMIDEYRFHYITNLERQRVLTVRRKIADS